jgi:hypothetical protein
MLEFEFIKLGGYAFGVILFSRSARIISKVKMLHDLLDDVNLINNSEIICMIQPRLKLDKHVRLFLVDFSI